MALRYEDDDDQAGRVERLKKFWSCPKHEDCWGGRHLSTAQVVEETKRHTDDCHCWMCLVTKREAYS